MTGKTIFLIYKLGWLVIMIKRDFIGGSLLNNCLAKLPSALANKTIMLLEFQHS